MKNFSMWDETIEFRDGWFVYVGGDGNNSVMTRECAKSIEEGYHRYQASMDVDRGGLEPDEAFQSRGFQKVGRDYVYDMPYIVDMLPDGKEEIKVGKRLEIPSEVDGIPITCVHKNAFSKIQVLEVVMIPESIASIGSKAFADCVNLHKVNLPERPIVIKKDAFEGTSINEEGDDGVWYIGRQLIQAHKGICGTYEIKEGTLSIADLAFKECVYLEKVVIPGSVKVIGNQAFSECIRLKDLVMPGNLNELGAGAFYKCSNLERVVVPEGIQNLGRSVFEKCEALEELKLPETLTSISFDSIRETKILNEFEKSKEKALYIGNWLISYRADFDGELTIKQGTIGIADQWLLSGNIEKRNLSSLLIPASMKYIGISAFERCADLREVSLPEGLISLGQSAFRDCLNLRNVIIPKSVQNVDQWAFMGCESINSITFLSSKTVIIWPAITDRKDRKSIEIKADKGSSAEEYCNQYGVKYNLLFIQIP
ncbi:MAG TPA: leucine-rich repeat domain-containing protein [Lachnospiraceae bacterium]|nr:leucine-rich repeat domain-containing protein [Lachnospiraceae bacterium]